MTFLESVKRNLTTSAFCQIQGRATRSEYWWWVLFFTIITLIPFVNLLSLVLFIPNICLLVRRLHDTNHSGKLVLIQYVGAIALCLLGALVGAAIGSDAGVFVVGAGIVLFAALQIYIFILTLLPSVTTDNKY